MSEFRIGHGYDVHRLVLDKSRRLILGGVEIPFELSLLGHSDADVLLHAISDSLLGAVALGDIGKHFPDDNDDFLNADSLVLLKKVYEMISANGFQIGNIDATVIAQAPKLSPYIDAMRMNISKALSASLESISVKATTEEGLGFTGNKEGIVAHCVCLLIKK